MFPFGNLKAQIYKNPTPLHDFFKSNFDSTIIYYRWSSWFPYPNYYIISKKDSSVYYFTYKSQYSKFKGLYYPADLHKKFSQEELKFKLTTPDTNRYFLPVYIHFVDRHMFWSRINSFHIWNIKETNENNTGCDIDDGGSDTYYLITNKGIEVKTFYAADFYEGCKPGNVYLINEIKTRDTILKAFGN